MKKRRWGYEPSPKSRAREMVARTGAAERLDAIERQKAEYAADDDAPLPDAPRRLSLAERTAAKRAQLPPGLDLDAQISRDKEVALGRLNSPEFVQQIVEELGLSETGARLYALALRSIETPEPRQVMVAIPIPGRERANVPVVPTGHPMLPPSGWATYLPSRLPSHAILGLPPSTQLTGPQWAEAARIQQAAHEEWESRDLLQWIQRPSWGLLRL
jgi:hypothetical protein